MIIPCSSPDAIFDTVFQQKPVEVIILELERPFDKAFDLLSNLKARLPAEVVVVSRFDDELLWVEAIQRGASRLPLQTPGPLGTETHFAPRS